MALILQQDGKVLRSSVNDLDALRTEFWDVLLHGDKMGSAVFQQAVHQLDEKTDNPSGFGVILCLVGVLEKRRYGTDAYCGGKHPGKCGNFEQISSVCRAAAIVASILVAFFTTRHITKPLQ
ncbi:MAG: hypothetical protein ACLTDV_13705 [Eubacterium sp.]